MGFRRLFKEFSRWIDCFLLKEMNRVLMVCVANGLLLISNGQLLVSMYVTCIICMISCRWSACCFEVQWFVKGRVSGPHTTISWEGLLKRQKKNKGRKAPWRGKRWCESRDHLSKPRILDLILYVKDLTNRKNQFLFFLLWYLYNYCMYLPTIVVVCDG